MASGAAGSGASKATGFLHDKREKHLDFDVEAWYPLLAPVTFGTKFLDLGLPQARALMAHYSYRYNNRRELTAEELSVLRALEEAITASMAEGRAEFGGATEFFVRLSSRSPKDAVLVTPAEYEAALWRVEADAAYAGAGTVQEINRKMVALSDCTGNMAVASGLEAMKLLAASERVFSDLNTATASDELYAAHPVKVILRVWDSGVDQRMEFRAFVFDGQLTAISQYNHYCFFPEVVLHKPQLLRLLSTFWATEVRDRVVVPNYVVDFAVMGLTSAAPRVTVVELNPFASTTGACLYDWRGDEEALRKGPLSFRVHAAPLPQIEELVEVAIEEVYSPTADLAPAEVAWRPDAARRGRCILM